MGDYILVIDEGTTSTRAIVFDRDLNEVALAQQEVPLSYPNDGWVEQDGEEIWDKTVEVCRAAIEQAGGVDQIAGIGITNQRETTLVWDRKTGQPIHRAIVWQDRRTAPMCQSLREAGHEQMVTDSSGLLLDPYFSGCGSDRVRIEMVSSDDPYSEHSYVFLYHSPTLNKILPLLEVLPHDDLPLLAPLNIPRTIFLGKLPNVLALSNSSHKRSLPKRKSSFHNTCNFLSHSLTKLECFNFQGGAL